MPHLGGQAVSFEEFCCQLARKTVPIDANFHRIRGAGGDGGVECFADLVDGTRIGWQAKYIFEFNSFLRQAEASLKTALDVHDNLAVYIICFPFDLTGPTARGKSQLQRFEEWRITQQNGANESGRKITIVPWTKSELISILLREDLSGGLLQVFFDETVLSAEWFSRHIERAVQIAGPRYTPEVNVETEAWDWFSSYGNTPNWIKTFERRVEVCRQSTERFPTLPRDSEENRSVLAWTPELIEQGERLAAATEAAINHLSDFLLAQESETLNNVTSVFRQIIDELRDLVAGLDQLAEAKYGPGTSGSINFRQFNADYLASFPLADLDYLKEGLAQIEDLNNWLNSPAGFLAGERTMILTGPAGSGKTHSICDVARGRQDQGFSSCIVFGHEFNGAPNLWSRLLEVLDLPGSLGREGLLDALSVAAEMSGFPLILFIDAINETRPLSYWRDNLADLFHGIQSKPNLKCCISCRTSFTEYCVPAELPAISITHPGFAGREVLACQVFFKHYGLKPPPMPVLMPELENPLYLKLVCEMLSGSGMDHLPSGWSGISPAIEAFIDYKERIFSESKGTRIGSALVHGALKAIASAISDSGNISLAWSEAERIVDQSRPQASKFGVVQWLVEEDLLIEEAPLSGTFMDGECSVRLGFERLGDFLVASQIIDAAGTDIGTYVVKPGTSLQKMLADVDSIRQNRGVLGALSVLIPERITGLELPEIVGGDEARKEAIDITTHFLPWRAADSLSDTTGAIVLEALEDEALFKDAMNSLISAAWRPSAIDAKWLNARLDRIPLAERDAFWCGWLLENYEANLATKRLITAAFEISLEEVDLEISECWAIILSRFVAAADRRIKDQASRALIRILICHPQLIETLIQIFMQCDDDEIKEHVLLLSYGALLLLGKSAPLLSVANVLHSAFEREPFDFDNAQVRDHVRSIIELASYFGVLPPEFNSDFCSSAIQSGWPLSLPSDEDVERWKSLPRLATSCLSDDFFVYSMSCLRRWEHEVPRDDMAKWILQHVASELGYEGSGCEAYDACILRDYGAGRGKPKWAERIGKKYQWIAMYQLASRLYDNVEAKYPAYEPEPQRKPLILLEERKLDPTLPYLTQPLEASVSWPRPTKEPCLADSLDDDDWVTKNEDFPDLTHLLACQAFGSQWIRIFFDSTWTNFEERFPHQLYRLAWAQVRGYFVAPREALKVFEELGKKNTMDFDLPSSRDSLYGFIGEYPWATAFNLGSYEFEGKSNIIEGSIVQLVPSWEQISVEWEYDSTIPGNRLYSVPSREFFGNQDLWWNGIDGFCKENGEIVFACPYRVTESPLELFADRDELLQRLQRKGASLIWTLMGSKQVSGGLQFRSTKPMRYFSQVGLIDAKGIITFSDFNHYDR